MSLETETMEQSAARAGRADDFPVPGLVLLFSSGEPMQGVLPLQDGALEIGRGELRGVHLRDACMSRRHARVVLEDDEWVVTDHGSRNGSAVDGTPLTGMRRGAGLRVLRTGESLFLLCKDVRPFQQAPLQLRSDWVCGPGMRPAFEQIRRAAMQGVLHIHGETGSGKEIAARMFHEYGGKSGEPFVAVNCAAIPTGLAEGLFFGSRKGAYSGATADSDGYFVAADGGTLFLDEVAELDLDVQAKLLRVVETHEVIPLGAQRPRKVHFRICSATHRALRDAVATGGFRQDLYYRIGRPQVELLPLRSRIEDIPLLVEREVRRLSSKLVLHASFVEACLLFDWPGNVRELLIETRDAVRACLDADETVLRAARLSASAGKRHEAPGSKDTPDDGRPEVLPAREVILAELQRCSGRVATAARNLGVHRTQLRRWLEKNAIDVKQFRESDDPGSDGDGT